MHYVNELCIIPVRSRQAIISRVLGIVIRLVNSYEAIVAMIFVAIQVFLCSGVRQSQTSRVLGCNVYVVSAQGLCHSAIVARQMCKVLHTVAFYAFLWLYCYIVSVFLKQVFIFGPMDGKCAAEGVGAGFSAFKLHLIIHFLLAYTYHDRGHTYVVSRSSRANRSGHSCDSTLTFFRFYFLPVPLVFHFHDFCRSYTFSAFLLGFASRVVNVYSNSVRVMQVYDASPAAMGSNGTLATLFFYVSVTTFGLILRVHIFRTVPSVSRRRVFVSSGLVTQVRVSPQYSHGMFHSKAASKRALMRA